MLVGLKWISAAFGILAATTAGAQAQGIAPGANQATAEAVATSLRSSAALSGYRIDIESRGGSVTLSGTVANQAQKAEAIARARTVQGVSLVSDQISVAGESAVQPVQYQVAMGHGGGGASYGGGMAGAPAGGGMVGGGFGDGPMPEGAAGMTGGAQASAPGAPNYAWPSYAPYPNYSAVGYPTVYPWQAWPNIGPPHPYPEVPLDWRAVTLRLDDGIWWLDFKKHYTRPFFTPYPFGLFAY